jgi:peptidoglycan/LPS O-acetylase OafA/YrhL
VLAIAAFLALATFLVRLVQPIGTNVSNFQLCFFPQYLVAFALGIILARQGALDALARSRVAAVAGWLGLVGGPVLLAIVLVLGGPIQEGGVPYFGGAHWQAFGLATWEQFAGVGLGLGMLAWFARQCERDTPALRWLSDRAFAVYVLHAPVLVGLTMLFRPLEAAAGPFLMAALLTLTGLVASYIVADVSRRLPGLRAIL